MSNAKPKLGSEINLEEFERRLRAATSPPGVEDPLAELTRLVDTIAAERPASDNVLSLTGNRLPKAEPLAAAPARRPEPPRRADPPPVISIAPPAPRELRPTAPLRSEAPMLRASFQEPTFEAQNFEAPGFDATSFEAAENEGVQSQAPFIARVERPSDGEAEQAAASPPRSRNWRLKIGGLVAAAALMAGTAVVFKVGMHGGSKTPPMILAAITPTKVAPPSDAATQTTNDSGALLQKDTAQPTSVAAKLLSTAEQPMDLSARPSPQASTASNLVATNDSSPVAPMPTSPIVAPLDSNGPSVSPLAQQGQRVKTISVRPDGTLITSSYETASAESEPAAAPPAPKKPDVHTATEPASPNVDLPTKLAPPKSSARVVSRTDTTAPAEATDPAPPAHGHKAKPPKDPAVADLAPADAPSTGGWAVQLAGTGSESEAQGMVSRLSSKYADALGGAAISVHKADRNGSAIYRVRSGGMSKSDASELCKKVKAAGGDCFLAKN